MAPCKIFMLCCLVIFVVVLTLGETSSVQEHSMKLGSITKKKVSVRNKLMPISHRLLLRFEPRLGQKSLVTSTTRKTSATTRRATTKKRTTPTITTKRRTVTTRTTPRPTTRTSTTYRTTKRTSTRAPTTTARPTSTFRTTSKSTFITRPSPPRTTQTPRTLSTVRTTPKSTTFTGRTSARTVPTPRSGSTPKSTSRTGSTSFTKSTQRSTIRTSPTSRKTTESRGQHFMDVVHQCSYRCQTGIVICQALTKWTDNLYDTDKFCDFMTYHQSGLSVSKCLTQIDYCTQEEYKKLKQAACNGSNWLVPSTSLTVLIATTLISYLARL